MLKRIKIDPEVCHGKPVIKGTRILVSNILSDLATGHSIEEIIEDYPSLTREDVLAAISFAGYLSNFETSLYDIHNI
ncbi:MAG: DUF433 domain-containing protein [Ignavibacteriaceae bacterium]|jgi:uncharacterized protein (DUF433 family)|nr:DUF433 domain-containing protein [Ignavibacteriaceae bacterium]